MTKISFTILGNPVAQGRPRFSTAGGFVKAYDPANSRDYKNYVRLAASVQMAGREPLIGPLAVSVRVYRAIPKSMSKKKAVLAEAGELRPVTKPDADNYLKGVADALKGVCWRDDSQIVDMMVGKWYSARPRVEVDIVALYAEREG